MKTNEIDNLNDTVAPAIQQMMAEEETSSSGKELSLKRRITDI